ncbi:proton-conducting transporter membrane subunit, partial [Agrobacterium pusense]
QNDIRRMLGYIVISGIGYMMAGIAIGTPSGVSGAIFYALHSMVLMTALYLAAGHAARLGGGFSLTVLGGLYRQAPWFSALALALFFAGSGLPPFSGFWPKAVLVKSAIDIGAWWLAAAILLSGFIATIAFGRVFLLCFWRPAAKPLPQPALPAAAPSVAPLVALTLLVVFFGLFPESLLDLSQDAAAGLGNPQAYIHSVFPEGGKP